jgi:hypothetical protein
MKNEIPLSGIWTLFVGIFIVFGVTHILVAGVFADILFLVAVVESIRKFVAHRKSKRSEPRQD